jgi:hypothetical protein
MSIATEILSNSIRHRCDRLDDCVNREKQLINELTKVREAKTAIESEIVGLRGALLIMDGKT